MLPFTIQLQKGLPVSDQIVFAVHRALALRQLKPGDDFPSQRTIAHELQINPNTAQKIITQLKHEGILVVDPGRGTLINPDLKPQPEAVKQLLGEDLEAFVVKAMRLGLTLGALNDAVSAKWKSLSAGTPRAKS